MVSVEDNGTTESVDRDELRTLFAESGRIASAADLKAMAGCGDNPVKRRFYGKPNGSTWEYPVTASFSISHGAVYNTLGRGAAVKFLLSGSVKVTLTDLPAGYRPIVCEGEEGAALLYDIMCGTYEPVPGIES